MPFMSSNLGAPGTKPSAPAALPSPPQGQREALNARPPDYHDPKASPGEYGNVGRRTRWEVDRARNMAATAANRQAYQQDFGDYQNAMGQAGQAREGQADALAMQREAALGNAPSRAELLGRQMADQGLQSQMAMAASSRGGSLAQAAAMRNAQQGQGAYMQQAENQMAGLRAEEMSNARNAYMAGASGMRGQDMGAAQLGLQRTGMETQNEQFQRQLNQQGQQFGEQMAADVLGQQLKADAGTAQLHQADKHHDDDRVDKLVAATAGAVGSIGGKLLGLATGGHFDGSTPLLVGEKGPEIVLPRGPGTVLNAHQTQAVMQQTAPSVMSLYEPEGQQLHMSADGHGFLASAPSVSGGASIAGPSPRYSLAQAASAARQTASEPPPKAKTRKMTPEELMAQADAMMGAIKREEALSLAKGPAVRVDRDEPAPPTMATLAAQQRQLDALSRGGR